MDVPIVVYKNRTTRLFVSLGIDVSGDELAAHIKAEADVTADVIVPWTITFVTDGVDGELVLTIDNSLTVNITHTTGVMDMKRTSGGEPMSVFPKPLPVVFRNAVTA